MKSRRDRDRVPVLSFVTSVCTLEPELHTTPTIWETEVKKRNNPKPKNKTSSKYPFQ